MFQYRHFQEVIEAYTTLIWCRGFQSVSAPEKAGGGYEIRLPDAPDATSTTFGYC